MKKQYRVIMAGNSMRIVKWVKGNYEVQQIVGYNMKRHEDIYISHDFVKTKPEAVTASENFIGLSKHLQETFHIDSRFIISRVNAFHEEHDMATANDKNDAIMIADALKKYGLEYVRVRPFNNPLATTYII